jgi:hypothetical protein
MGQNGGGEESEKTEKGEEEREGGSPAESPVECELQAALLALTDVSRVDVSSGGLPSWSRLSRSAAFSLTATLVPLGASLTTTASTAATASSPVAAPPVISPPFAFAPLLAGWWLGGAGGNYGAGLLVLVLTALSTTSSNQLKLILLGFHPAVGVD